MKKILLTTLLSIGMAFMVKAQVDFSGKLPYRTTPENSWDGIDVDFNIGIKGSTSVGGVAFYETVYSINVNSVKIRQREIPASEIPAHVLSKLKQNISVGTVSFDLYVNSSFVKKMTTRSNIGWAQLQGLDNAEGYKQAVRDKGFKLFNSGALSIKNVSIKAGSYMIDAEYRNAIEKEITGGGKKAITTASKGKANSEVTELGLKMSDSSSSGSESSSSGASSEKGSAESSASSSSDVTVHNNMFAAAAAKRYAEEKAYQDLATGVYNLFAPSPERLAREQKEREYAQRVAVKEFELGQELIKDNLAKALKGDSAALQNTYYGYLKTGKKETAMELVNKMHQQYRTKATLNILSTIYKAEEARYKSDIDLYKFDIKTNRTYAYMMLGGAAAAVPLLFKNQLVTKYGDDAGMATYILAGAGGVSLLSAIIAKMTIPPLSSKKKYKEAIEGLKNIKGMNLQANVFPLYSPLSKAPMLGLNIKF
ncbi:hypothetical protein [Pedobacter frigoris]|uniref:Uncharacterized protein n=1 Tax=Pedobacter frigoris TaxID=2571272 RepID=A0A4U1CHU0_9SPHI|nr:hypothetical protein [Pedobacter frigoris]TKC06177.1 hypothetical protein FA047_12705 [Pedobacter frigoris]